MNATPNPEPRVIIDGRALPPEAVAFELARLVRFYREHMPEDQVRAQLPLLRKKAAEQAIGARLLLDEAGRLDLPVTDAEVDARVAEMRKQAGGAAKFAALLRKQGLELPALREQIRRGRRVDRLIERVTAGVPEPGEEEMRAHFEAHRAEYNRAERAQALHILARPTGTDAAAHRAARAKMDAIRERLLAGADFAAEAAAHSECPSGRSAGGSLGWFGRGAMLPAFDQAVFSMEVGALSEIVETPLGLHLIRKTGQEDAVPATYEEVRDSVRDFLRHAARGAALAAHVADLRARARIEMDPAT